MRNAIVPTFALLTLAGCFHILTPTELGQRSNRRFENTSQKEATQACAKALETLGYKVTVTEPAKGLVKTAPKSMYVTASGGAGYATAHEDSLAWNLFVVAKGDGVNVNAVPRGFRDGDDISARGFPDAVIDPKFQSLWNEIASTIGTPAIATASAP